MGAISMYLSSAADIGVEESDTLLDGQTRSRVAYTRPWNKANWVATNANDDFLTPYREDYSVALATTGIYLASGIKLDLHQSFSQRVLLPTDQFEYAQLTILNTTGRLCCKRVRVESQTRSTSEGVRT